MVSCDFQPKQTRRWRGRGQTLVLVACFLPVALLLLTLVVGVASAVQQKRAVQDVVEAAARAGSQQVDIEELARGRLMLECGAARSAILDRLRADLENLPYVLDNTTVDELVATAQIEVVNLLPGSACSDPDGDGQWTSPWPPNNVYTRPVVTVHVRVPSRVLLVWIPLPGLAEDEMRAVGGTP